ncbi:hypothetical protein EJB05_25197, partial [Eragrostis curvula]
MLRAALLRKKMDTMKENIRADGGHAGREKRQVFVEYVHLRALLLDRTVQPGTPDSYVWRWTSNGIYSSKSAYAMLNQGSEQFQGASRIWNTWAPLKVKIFFWLASRRRIWTSDRRRRHGLAAAPRCALCDQESETCDHLLVTCPFAREVWWQALSWAKCSCQFGNASTLQDWWEQSEGHQPETRRKGFNTLFMLTAWSIWKERNARVFEGKISTSSQVVQRIKGDAELWAQGGAKKLGCLCWE